MTEVTRAGLSTVLAVGIVVAAFVIRSAVAELRRPGSARKQWAFLRNRRARRLGAAAGLITAVLSYPSAGYGAAAWALLGALLIAFVVDHVTHES